MTGLAVATVGGNDRVTPRDLKCLGNLIGDTTWCRGVVTGKSEDAGEALAHLELRAVNQRGETTARGTATVALPRRP